MDDGGGAVLRCAVHPGRPAVDDCPVCGRARCAGCRAVHGDRGCPADVVPAASVRRPPGDLERLVRGTLAALGAALLGGLVASEYVGSPWFSLLTPVVVGAGCGAAAQAAAGGPRRGPTATRLRAVAVALAVLGTGLGFLLEGSRAPVSAGALVPCALAAGGALLWTAPPRRRQAPPASDRAVSAPGGRAG